MNLRQIAGNFGFAAGSQIVSFCASAAMSLLVPKVLGVEEFGFWQLYIFYSSYVGVFYFGLPDGIYLKDGGKTRAEIEKRQIGSQFRVGMISQVVIAAAIAALSMALVADGDRVFVLLAVALTLVLSNAAVYLGIVFQTMNETKLYSISVIVERATFLAMVIALLLMRTTSYQPYIVAGVASKGLSLLYCLFHAREFVKAPFLGLRGSVALALDSMRVGLPLTIANLGSMLILGAMRATVDAVWGISSFGQLSLTISIVNFALVLVSQLGMVLYPALRQSDDSEKRRFYDAALAALDAILPFSYLLYFPLLIFIDFWLPQYSDALVYLAYLMPMCVFDAKTNLLFSTFLKVERRERTLLAINVLASAVSLFLSLFCAYVLGDRVATVMSAVIATGARSFIAGYLCAQGPKRAAVKSIAADAVMAAVFVLAASRGGLLIGLAVSAAMVAINAVYHRNFFKRVTAKLLPRGGKGGQK